MVEEIFLIGHEILLSVWFFEWLWFDWVLFWGDIEGLGFLFVCFCSCGFLGFCFCCFIFLTGSGD